MRGAPWAIGLLTVFGALLPACSSDEKVGDPPTTSESSGELARFRGALRGDRDCLSLEIEVEGDQAQRALIFPSGTTTKESDGEVVLLSSNGDEIARVGDEVLVTGGFRPGAESCVEGEDGAIVASAIESET